MRPESLSLFGLEREDVEKVLRFAAFAAKKYKPEFLFRPNLTDENDNMFVELAVVSHSEYLITNNVKDY